MQKSNISQDMVKTLHFSEPEIKFSKKFAYLRPASYNIHIVASRLDEIIKPSNVPSISLM